MKMDYDKRQMHLNKMKEQKAKYDDQVKQATKRMEKFVKDETSLNDLVAKQNDAKANLSGAKLQKQEAAILATNGKIANLQAAKNQLQ